MSKIIKSIKLKYFKYYYLEFILVLIQMVNKKGLYGNKENNFSTEISIYSEKEKINVLEEHNSKTNLPFYISFMLMFLKYFYYNLGIIPKNIYKYLKRVIMNYMVEGEDVEFITTDVPTE